MTAEELTYRFFGSALVALNQYDDLNRYIETVVPSPDTELTKEDGQDIFDRIHIVEATIGKAVEDASNALDSPDIPDSIRELIVRTCNLIASWKERLDWLTLGIEDIIWTQSTGYIDRLLNDIRQTASGFGAESEPEPEAVIEEVEDVPIQEESVDESDVSEIGPDELEQDEGPESEEECEDAEAPASAEDADPAESIPPTPDDGEEIMRLSENGPIVVGPEPVEPEHVPNPRVYTQEEVDRLIGESVANALRMASEQSAKDSEETKGTKVTRRRSPKKSGVLRKKKGEEAAE